MQLPLYRGENVMSLMGATSLRPDRYTRYKLTSSYHSPVAGDDAPTIIIN